MLSFAFAPVYQLLAVLIALSALAMGFPAAPSSAEWIHLFLIVGFGMLAMGGLRYISKKAKPLSNALITFLIIFLVLEPTTASLNLGLTQVALLSGVGVAVLIKFAGEFAERAIFNPAIAGIVIALILSLLLPGTGVTADSSRLVFTELFSAGGISVSFTAVILAAWIFWGLPKWNRLWVFSAFLITMGVITYFFDGGMVGVGRVFSASPFFYFFASIILTDPKTSPDPILRQVIYGVATALVISLPVIFPLIGGVVGSFVVEYRYFIGLLLMNFLLFLWTASRGG